MDVREHNRRAWDAQVIQGNPWTIPVGEEEIRAARGGRCRIFLTPTRAVPDSWLGRLENREVLCLASGGGQLGPLLAAAGARVTVLDNSPLQLEQDRRQAERYSLELRTVEGDMRDLSPFRRDTFDLVVHPVSNAFVPEVRPVWAEAFRVLRPGAGLLAAFGLPIRYIFDDEAYENGELKPVHRLPYSDLKVLDGARIEERRKKGEPLEFSHSLEDQLGGQLGAGFLLADLYEDRDREEEGDLLSGYAPTYIATRALKPAARESTGNQPLTGDRGTRRTERP